VIAALIGMFLLVQAGFQSWRLAALLFVSLPFALVGGVAAAMIDGAQLSLGAWMGLLAVFALARPRRDAAFPPLPGSRGGGQEPIGVPLVEPRRPRSADADADDCRRPGGGRPADHRSGRQAGAGDVAPMAAVVLGGMVTTVLLITTSLPALYLRFAVPSPGIAEAVEHERWDQLKPRASVALPAPAAEAAGGADGSGSKGCRQGTRAMPTLRWCSRPATLAVLLAALAGAGCTEVEDATVTGYEPARLESSGGDGGTRVVFTEEGLERSALETGSAVRSGARVAVPSEAVMYEPDGKTFVYTVVAPRTYLARTCRWIASTAVGRAGRRAARGHDGRDGRRREVYGAELEIAGSH
jgi:hypothetical protein